MPQGFQRPLSDDERVGIVLAVRSAFATLRGLYEEMEPLFERYGFSVPSTGVIARDLAEKIEGAIAHQCSSFTRGEPQGELQRDGRAWHVHVSKDVDLSISQSKVVAGENYVVVNYRANTDVFRIWVLWDAQDHFFSPKRPSTSARALITSIARQRVEVLYEAAVAHPRPTTVRAMAKAALTTSKRRSRIGS